MIRNSKESNVFSLNTNDCSLNANDIKTYSLDCYDIAQKEKETELTDFNEKYDDTDFRNKNSEDNFHFLQPKKRSSILDIMERKRSKLSS